MHPSHTKHTLNCCGQMPLVSLTGLQAETSRMRAEIRGGLSGSLYHTQTYKHKQKGEGEGERERERERERTNISLCATLECQSFSLIAVTQTLSFQQGEISLILCTPHSLLFSLCALSLSLALSAFSWGPWWEKWIVFKRSLWLFHSSLNQRNNQPVFLTRLTC